MAVSFCFLRTNLKPWQFISQETICFTIRQPPKATPNGFLTPRGLGYLRKGDAEKRTLKPCNELRKLIYKSGTYFGVIHLENNSFSFWTFCSKRALTPVMDKYVWQYLILLTWAGYYVVYKGEMWRMNLEHLWSNNTSKLNLLDIKMTTFLHLS